MPHASDCAIHNAPALPASECDCGGVIPKLEPDKLCAFCGVPIKGAHVEAASGLYCLGHEPSACPTESDRIIARLKHAAIPVWKTKPSDRGGP
jgi:hypothetical protein